MGTLQIQHRLRLSDDATGAGSVYSLNKWWDNIIGQGNRFGYYANRKKPWIILKDDNVLQKATAVLNSSGINKTTEGKIHL